MPIQFDDEDEQHCGTTTNVDAISTAADDRHDNRPPLTMRWILDSDSQALAGLVEMPAIAIAIFIIGRIGQKWLFCATFFCAGLACLCATFVEGQQHMMWLKITFVMIGMSPILLLLLLPAYNSLNLFPQVNSQLVLATLLCRCTRPNCTPPPSAMWAWVRVTWQPVSH